MAMRLVLLGGDIERNPGPAQLAEAQQEEARQEVEVQREDPRPEGGDLLDRLHGWNSPGNMDVMVTSYNVRGLNDECKLRHLINCCYKNSGGKNREDVYCLQETYIEMDGKIPYLWRGNYHLTSGRGNSPGCLTLLSSHINIIAKRDFEQRAWL